MKAMLVQRLLSRARPAMAAAARIQLATSTRRRSERSAAQPTPTPPRIAMNCSRAPKAKLEPRPSPRWIMACGSQDDRPNIVNSEQAEQNQTVRVLVRTLGSSRRDTEALWRTSSVVVKTALAYAAARDGA